MSPLDQVMYGISIGDPRACLIAGILLFVTIMVGARIGQAVEAAIRDIFSTHSYTQTPMVYEEPRIPDEWYRDQTQRTDDEIAYLVKQAELEETREWLARRNK